MVWCGRDITLRVWCGGANERGGLKAALHDFGDRPCTDSIFVLCCGSGVNRGYVTSLCAYVDTVNDCRVSVGANERLHR